jgi:transcriptional regulator GlxA family with amidase domain
MVPIGGTDIPRAKTDKRSMMQPDDRPAEIGLLLYPGAQLAAIHGLTDLFQVANLMARTHAAAGAPPIRVSHWQQDAEAMGIGRVFDTHPGTAGRTGDGAGDGAGDGPRFIVAPPSLSGLPEPAVTAGLALWLAERHAGGATLASVCMGAYLLAETGLLEGRTVTTHWSQADALAGRFPGIRVDAEKLIVDDGDIITAGGVMAWTDLGLRLVDRLLGPAVMIETARFLLIDPPGREQRFYSSFSPKLHHGDDAILKVQHWLQAHGARDATLGTMAATAGLEERTFLRRFRRATGLKPTEYCQHLRIGKAREMLEFTRQTVERIAWDVGYEDPGAFRKVFSKVFSKITGLSPGDYRRRFGAELS